MESSKVHVCCSVSESRMIGPYLFDDDTINRQNSHSILNEFFVAELQRLDKANSGIFREDRAPPHFSRVVRQYFNKISSNRWIGRSGAHQMGITFL